MDDLSTIDNAYPDPKKRFPAWIKLPFYHLPDAQNPSSDLKEFLMGFSQATADYQFPLVLGRDTTYQAYDIANQPNVLIAGATGSGKTQFIYNQLAFWLSTRRPEQLQILICGSKPIDYHFLDPLNCHFLAAHCNKIQFNGNSDFLQLMNSLTQELNHRLECFTMAGVKSITQYNKLYSKQVSQAEKPGTYLPDLVLIIDDLYNFVSVPGHADLLSEVMHKTSNTGIYILAATSQVNSSAVSRKLRANFVFRIAMKVMSQSDSRKILDETGAEHLQPGQLLYNLHGQHKKLSFPEIPFDVLKKLVSEIAAQAAFQHPYALYKQPEMQSEYPLEKDRFFEEAARIVVMHQQASTSLLQRKLKLGYNRVGRIMDQLEHAGIVGPFDGLKPRIVCCPDEYSLEQFLSGIGNTKYNAGEKDSMHPINGILQPAPPAESFSNARRDERIIDKKERHSGTASTQDELRVVKGSAFRNTKNLSIKSKRSLWDIIRDFFYGERISDNFNS
ncbi:hypothetical protein DHW03_01635 [Pedobacter yonginense]|uniref:FtsK domain-containing protein n=1 Tax=Pedobacter yonginense TaxID=651869 RepID=A0A317ENZ1_9SPHI|nr:DNA translocase FtsK [Pedobacter yonginense]PWS28580.1 hypothetical protein DHW03_01635 [Pedobacter yonginense]